MKVALHYLVLSACIAISPGCSCNSIPEVHGCDTAVCIGPKAEHQVSCECTMDVSGTAETFTSSVDQQFVLNICLPPDLNTATADPTQLAALNALDDAHYAAAVQAYCQDRVAPSLLAMVGLLTGSDSRACSNVATSCVATIGPSGRATSLNNACDLPCANTACDTTTCPPCEVNEGCNDPSLRGVHPDQCKCTSVAGCGVTSENVCTNPSWAPDPPTIATGIISRLVSQPSEIRLDPGLSHASISAFVDATDPCGSDTANADPHISGSLTLYGVPCPGAECDMMLEMDAHLDDFDLNFDFGLCGSGSGQIRHAALATGTEGLTVHIGSDGNVVIPPGKLRIIASAVVTADSATKRQTFDAINSQPIAMRVDFAAKTFAIIGASLPVTDGSATLDLVGTIVNQPPRANAGPDQVVECNHPNSADVTLDGSGSTDPDGSADFRSFVWWGGAAFDASALIDFGPTIHTVQPSGGKTYELTVSDLRFITSSNKTTVTVVDTTAPVISASVTPHVLWPPNHKMIDIDATIAVTDVCDPAPTFVLTSITSNEPDNGLGDGDTAPDIDGADFGTADTHFRLRAERQGGGNGRRYTIVYTVTDSSGNSRAVSVFVDVPHDMSP